MYHITKGITHNLLIDRMNALRASHWNAKLVPRVRGRMMLNIDIMLAWLRHRDEDVGRLFVNLQRIHGNTFNTRVLGEDQILSLDPVVFDYVMNTGFDEFEKGIVTSMIAICGADRQDQSSEAESEVSWETEFSIPMVNSEFVCIE
jgi:hypothetical protein